MTRPGPATLLLALNLLGLPLVHAQQICAPLTPASSAQAGKRFTDHGDGTVTDEVSQLMWSRCAAGQSWRAGNCAGAATRLSWADAQAWAQDLNRSGRAFFNDWRLPSVRELATVTEVRCRNPRIDLAQFPGTPAAGFWSGNARPGSEDKAYLMDFSAAGVSFDAKSAAHHVRLVRTAP
jgi:hypothetical protein